jgi:hypothetical protein
MTEAYAAVISSPSVAVLVSERFTAVIYIHFNLTFAVV